MEGIVLNLFQKLQIVDVIIARVFVFVMNNLIAAQIPTYCRLHNKAVLHDVALAVRAWVANSQARQILSVPTISNRTLKRICKQSGSALLVAGVARFGTKLFAGFGQRNIERFSAISARLSNCSISPPTRIIAGAGAILSRMNFISVEAELFAAVLTFSNHAMSLSQYGACVNSADKPYCESQEVLPL